MKEKCRRNSEYITEKYSEWKAKKEGEKQKSETENVALPKAEMNFENILNYVKKKIENWKGKNQARVKIKGKNKAKGNFKGKNKAKLFFLENSNNFKNESVYNDTEYIKELFHSLILILVMK